MAADFDADVDFADLNNLLAGSGCVDCPVDIDGGADSLLEILGR